MEASEWADPASRPTNEHGSKPRIRQAAATTYSDWRRSIGDGCYANDVDWVESRIRDGRLVVVALIETTYYEDKPELRSSLPRYCDAALARFTRDGQCEVIHQIASALAVPVYFVIAREDLAAFFVWSFRAQRWRQMAQDDYRAWLKAL